MLILGPGYKSGCHSSCSTASCPILRSVFTKFYWPWSDGWGQAVETDWLLLYTTFGPWMISRAPLASPCGGSQATCVALSLSLSIQTHPVLRLSWSCKTSALRARHPPSFHYAHIHTRSHTLHSNTHTHRVAYKESGRMGRGEGRGRKDKAGFIVFRPFTWLEWTRQRGFPLHGLQAPPTSKIFWSCRNSCGMIPNKRHSD